MLIYVIQIIASMIVYFYLHKNTIRYFAAVTSVYFFAYLMSGSYDIALPIYYTSIFFGIRRISSIQLTDFLYCAYIVLYAVIGMFFQQLFLTVATVITRYGYILVFLWYLNSKTLKDEIYEASAEDFRFAVRLGIFTELMMIAFIWIKYGWGVRIITNNQPIGGGVVIALTLIIGYCYFTKKFSAAETIVYCLCSVVIILLSGTRGYMVILGMPMAVIAVLYLLDIPEFGMNAPFRIAAVLILLAFLIIGVIALDKTDTVSEILRIQEGLGYRENENVFVKEIMSVAPWYRKLFGFGLGGNANDVQGFYEVLKTASWNRPIMFYKLQSNTIFHNYWYTILFKQGAIGLIGVLGFYLVTLKRILNLKVCGWIRWMLGLALAGMVISLTFRITATCSTYEMLILGYFIRLFGNEKESGR